MNHTNHRANAGSFKRGQDQRRNTNGQHSKDAVALGALLKKYLIEEAGKPARWGDRGTNAQALAAEIWEQATQGKFPFVQFLADRLMGKVQLEDAQPDVLHARFAYDMPEQPKG